MDLLSGLSLLYTSAWLRVCRRVSLEFPQQVKAPEVLRRGAAGGATSQRWVLAADPQIQKPKYATHTVPTCSNVISRVSFGDVPWKLARAFE
jgi:hypothetical protein